MEQNVGINYDFTNMEGILMSRVIVYQSGGFTNYGIGYRKFSQDELEEREKGNDRRRMVWQSSIKKNTVKFLIQ